FLRQQIPARVQANTDRVAASPHGGGQTVGEMIGWHDQVIPMGLGRQEVTYHVQSRPSSSKAGRRTARNAGTVRYNTLLAKPPYRCGKESVSREPAARCRPHVFRDRPPSVRRPSARPRPMSELATLEQRAKAELEMCAE